MRKECSFISCWLPSRLLTPNQSLSYPPLLTIISSRPPHRLSASPSASSHKHSGSVSSSHTQRHAYVSLLSLFSRLPQVLLTRHLRRSCPNPRKRRNPIRKKSRRCFAWGRGRYNTLGYVSTASRSQRFRPVFPLQVRNACKLEEGAAKAHLYYSSSQVPHYPPRPPPTVSSFPVLFSLPDL